ncbi:hypothetical protein EON64_00200 [archaeon]|nr:MAG: hypothetical protein EON64_00200 [archaeon]
MALSVLAATAVCSEKDFLPYVGGVCNLLGAYLFNSDPNMFGIRGKALECLGHIAVGVGGESFRPYFADGMRSALGGCELNDDNLIEHCYVFVANVSKTMGEEFGGAGGGTNYVSLVLPRIIETLEESEVVEIGDSDEDEEGEGEEGGAHGGEGSDGGSTVSLRLNVEEGFINTKKAALTALGSICEHSGVSFAPFIVQVFPKIMDTDNCILNSLHDNIKGEGLSILHLFLHSLLKAKGYPLNKVDKALPPTTLPPVPVLDEDTRFLTTQIVQQLLEAVYEDESRGVAARAVEGLQGVVEALGGGGLQLSFQFRDTEKPLIQLVLEVIDMYFNARAPCQKDIEGGGEGAEDEEAGDSNLLDIVGELLTTLSAVLPATTFVPLFPAFFTPLCSYLKNTRTPSEKSFALGTMAEVFKYISQGGGGEAIIPYLPVLLPLVETSLTDLLEGVRRNAAFLVNVLIMGGGRGVAEHYPRFLTLLSPLCVRPAPTQTPNYLVSQDPSRVDVNATFTTSGGENFATIDAGGADVDNSLSALASMIRASFSLNFALPMKDILCAMLNALPLRGDVIEGDNIYGLLCEVNDLQHTVLTEACNVNSFHHWLRISNTNVSALRIDTNTSSVPLIVPLYAVLVQSVSGSSNLMKETKERVRAHLRNVMHNTTNSYSEFTRGYLQVYLSALNEAEVRDAVMTL